MVFHFVNKMLFVSLSLLQLTYLHLTLIRRQTILAVNLNPFSYLLERRSYNKLPYLTMSKRRDHVTPLAIQTAHKNKRTFSRLSLNLMQQRKLLLEG